MSHQIVTVFYNKKRWEIDIVTPLPHWSSLPDDSKFDILSYQLKNDYKREFFESIILMNSSYNRNKNIVFQILGVRKISEIKA
jgi:hypothetical protein